MENFALHMRISTASPSDDEVNSRREAAAALAVAWGKETSVSKLLAKAADVVACLAGDGKPSDELGAEVQSAIHKKKASSYLYTERPFDVGVCAGMALNATFKAPFSVLGWHTADVLATATWSALAYQAPLETDRRETLRQEVLKSAEARSRLAADKSRERVAVKDPADLNVTFDGSTITGTNFLEAILGTVEALRRNAILDREEIDFLWWAQLGRSRLLKRQLSDVGEPARIVSAGIEGAKILRRLPSEVHREIVLRTLDADPELDLSELLAALGDDRDALGASFMTGYPATHPTIFPLLHALATGEAEGSAAKVKRPLTEWGGRAILEAAFLKIASEGIGKL